MVRLGHSSSSSAALRYQHVMAGRDAAIAAALDELVQAASTLAEDQAAPPEWHAGGTRPPEGLTEEGQVSGGCGL
jgi:hypothetical protein